MNFPADDAKLEDTYVYDDVINISADSGNIGRFYWHNGCSLVIESGLTWPSFPWSPGYERQETIYPGSWAFVATVGDFWAWLFLD
jgi:hypothetical protein